MGRTAGKYLMEKPHKPQENSHTMVWYTIIIGETWSAPADSKLCFRLTKTGRFNGENAASRLQGYAPKSHLLFVYPNIVSIDIVCDLVFYFVPQIR